MRKTFILFWIIILSQSVYACEAEPIIVPEVNTLDLGEFGLDFRYRYQTLFLLWQPEQEFNEIGIRIGLYPKNLNTKPKGMELGIKINLQPDNYAYGEISLKTKILEQSGRIPGFALELFSTAPSAEVRFAGAGIMVEKQLGMIGGVLGIQGGAGFYHTFDPFTNFFSAISLAPFGPRFRIITEYTGKFNLGTFSAGASLNVFRGINASVNWMSNIQTLNKGEPMFFESHYGASVHWVFGVWDSSIKEKSGETFNNINR